MTRPILEAALGYARLGWRVLPLVPGTKVPVTQHGVHDATTDENKIRSWFDGPRGQSLNIGIACGKASGIVVFDIDPRNGGDTNWELWQEYHGGPPPDCPLQYTARGGRHYVAAYVSGIRSTKLAPGIDLLSDGLYFVAWPSVFEGREYVWEDSSSPVEMDLQDEGDEAVPIRPFVLPPNWLESVTAKKEPAAASTLADGLVRGNRNAGLTALAGAMRRYGLTEAEIHAALVVVNEQRCEIPLPASEVRAIAHSVARYDVESDVAASTALGDEIAENLLAAYEAANRTNDYYGTRGTAFLQQPSPIEWAIHGWVPSSGTAMVYGESGTGKTFLTLDWACHVATGKPWCGIETTEGVALYLAGEGNYGIRQRVAAWAKKHGVTNLDRLIVTNRAIDLDGQDTVSQVLRVARDCAGDQRIALVVVDTVNNHLSGDENQARDVRTLFGAINTIAAALAAPVVLNHHIGHGEGAQRRARGSSAFKASLDAAILLEGRDGVITLTCTKMKDGPMPAPLVGRLEGVQLDWTDKHGVNVSSAVWTQVTEENPAPPTTAEDRANERRNDRLERWRNLFERAWWGSGAELDQGGRPYVSRSALRDHLVSSQRTMRAATIEQHLKPSAREGSMVRDLLDTGYVEAHEHGWSVIDQEHAGILLMARDAR